MMAVHDTYREAGLANGSTKGVYTDGERFFTDGSELKDYGVHQCNPADYLETLESFLASGKRLVEGDSIILLTGLAVTVERCEEKDALNTKSDIDSERFVLHATADQVETPEEKEAFDAIDTTPQQVESLGKCQEFSDGIEWENGDLASLKSCGAELRVIGPCPYSPNHIFCLETVGNGEALYYHKSLLETPEEREEREREESARELYLLSNKVMAGTHMINHYSFQESKDVWLAIVDETGYRKEFK